MNYEELVGILFPAEEILHYGVGHLQGGHSGRYPWNSGKKHKQDKQINKGTEFQTLTGDQDRLKNTDMFYATYEKMDKAKYMSVFNTPVSVDTLDENGNVISSSKTYKFNISTIAKTDIKVAGEDSVYNSFKQLYQKDKDLHDYCTNKDRMLNYLTESTFLNDAVKYSKQARKGYNALVKMNKSDSEYIPNEQELKGICELFTTNLGYDGHGNKSEENDVLRQRTKIFNSLKENGYGAILDTFDANYFKVNSPVIVFDMQQIIPKSVMQTTIKDIKLAKKEFRSEKIKNSLIGKLFNL